jgi:hypothetical protein
MAESNRQLIINQVEAFLLAGPLPTGLTAANIRRCSPDGFEVDVTHAIAILPDTQPKKRDTAESTENSFFLDVHALAKGAPPIDKQLDPLIQYIVTMNGDPTLAGLCRHFEDEEIEWDFQAGDQDLSGAKIRFRFDFRTQPANEAVTT